MNHYISGIAHANVRFGLNDYNDGSSLNHNLGNDDYNGSNLPEDAEETDEILIGYEALGNNLCQDPVDDLLGSWN